MAWVELSSLASGDSRRCGFSVGRNPAMICLALTFHRIPTIGPVLLSTFMLIFPMTVNEPRRTARAVGRADFVLERDTLRFSWRVSFQALTSQPMGLHIHGPVPAEGEAPALFAIASENIESPVEGERILSLGEVAYLVQNLLYVNLLSSRYRSANYVGR